MRRLLLSLAVMLAILFAIDRVAGAGLEHLFRTSAALEDGDCLRRAWTYRAPIVVCGSSRAMHHYVVDSLAAELGVRAYNLGRDGEWGSVYEYGVAGVMLRHYTPKLWIMEVESDIERGPELPARLACFLPYVDDEPVAREVVSLRSRYEGLRLCSRIYRYNSLILSLLSPWLGKTARPRLGFLPLHRIYHPPAVADPPGEPRVAAPDTLPVDTLKRHYLRRAVELLRSRGVEVLAVRSPHYLPPGQPVDHDVREEADMRHLFGTLGVRYLDFTPRRVPALGDVRLYTDVTHLNADGALAFTRALADSLRALGLPR